MDVLSEIFQTLRLRGTVYFHAQFHAPWGMRIPQGQFANFHFVTQGSCWLRIGSDTPMELKRGDMAIFPHGTTHSLLHEKDAGALPAREMLDAPRSGDSLSFGGSGAPTTSLICGHFEYDREYPHPLFETLNPLVYVPGEEIADAGWLATASEMAVNLSQETTPGGNAVVVRLAEALFMRALAAHVMSREDIAGFLGAMQDRQIGKALALMHRDMAHEWTLPALARAALMSRSVFAQRFRALVGEPPMLYLSRWRMLKARELLLDTCLPLGRIAERVGYRSEFALSKAFKKQFGSPPGDMRKESASV